MKWNLLVAISIILASLNVVAVVPVILDFNIANNATYSNNANVLLYITATDAIEMQFTCNSSTWADWQSYNTSAAFNLNSGTACISGDGPKTVYARVRSSDGNVSEVKSDSIILDTNVPYTSIDLNSSAAYKNDITINFSCSDSTSDCNATAFRIDTDPTDNISFSSSSWVIASSFNTLNRTEITIDGNYAIDFNSTDKAGNIETTKRAYFIRDFANKPEIEFVSPTNASTVTSNQITFKAKDAISLVKLSSIKIDINANNSDFTPTNCSFLGDGTYQCQFNETRINKSSDYNLAIYLEDIAGNSDYAEIIFTYNDTTAPSKPATPALSSATTSSITILWQPNTDYDVNYYEIYRSPVSGFTPVDSNIVGVVFNSSCSASCSLVDTNNLRADLNYYYKIKAVDFTGNKSIASDQAGPFRLSQTTLQTPTISSSTHANDVWKNSNDVSFSWNSVSNATGYSYLFDETSDSSPDTSIDTSNTSISFNDVSDGIHYFHLRACNSLSCSSTAHFKVKIDTVNPERPTNISASSLSDGSIKLSWEPALDDRSGIQEYVIYRSTSSGFSLSSIYASTTETTFTDTETTNGTTYYYVLKAKDNAGNYSEASTEISKKAVKETEFVLTLNAVDYAKAGTITIEVTGNYAFTNGELKVKKPDSTSYTTLISDMDSSFTYNYTFSSSDSGTFEFYATVVYNGNVYSKTKNIVVDNGKPTISWLKPVDNAIISKVTELKVSASDSVSGIKEVNFYQGSKLLARISGNLGTFAYSWNVSALNDGKYNLRATATDNAGNIAETTISVYVVNAATEDEQNAKIKLIKAKMEKEKVDSLVNSFKSRNVIISTDLTQKIEQAISLINDAETLIKTKSFSLATEKLKNALQLLSSVSGSLKIEITATEEYSFDSNDISAFINAKVKTEALKDALSSSTLKYLKSKTIEVLKFSDSKKTERRIQVSIKVKNTSKAPKEVKVIEFIPASIALTRADFYSSDNFILLNENPLVVQFTAIIAPESEGVLRYSLVSSFNETMTDQQITNSVRADLEMPAIVFSNEAEIRKEDLVLPEIQRTDVLLPLVGAIVIILLLVAVFFVYQYLQKQKTSVPSTKHKWMHPEEKKRLAEEEKKAKQNKK